MKKTLLTTSILFTSSALAFNNTPVTDENPIETIVITANKFQQSLSEVLASVSVINRADIDASNPRDLVALLNTLPGIQISRNGGLGQNSSLFMRGTASKHSLVLVDGVRVGSATLGYKGLANIAINSIERIEVIKGSRAAVYGSDAIAGVVNIITRNSQHSSLTLTVGRHKYRSAQFAGQFKDDNVSLGLNLGYETQTGFDVLQGSDPDEDGYTNRNFGANLTVDLQSMGEISALLQLNSGVTAYDNNWDSVDDSIDKNRFESSHLSLGWNNEFGRYQHDLKLSLSADHSDSKRNATNWTTFETYVAEDKFSTKRNQIDYVVVGELDESTTISGGLNWYKDDVGGSSNSYIKETREVAAAFLGSHYKVDNWLLSANARYDDDQQFGNETTYNIALGYEINSEITVRASQNTGFKAPTFNDLYYPEPYPGNPNLIPETSLNKELGFKYLNNGVLVDVAVFDNNIDNLIAWSGIPKNINKSIQQGLEASAEFSVYGIENTVNFTYIDAYQPTIINEEKVEVKQVYVAPRTFNWQLRKQFDRLQLNLAISHKDSRKGRLVAELPAYTVVDLSANFQVKENLKFSLKVENLLDKQYDAVDAYSADIDGDSIAEFFYYNTQERAVYFSMGMQF